VPMLRDQPEDAATIDYCKSLQAELAKLTALGEPVRALLDLKAVKAQTKRWGWVKKGAPIVIEVGGRDVAGGNVSVIQRDKLYREDGKLNSQILPRADFVAEAAAILESIQQNLYLQARDRLDSNIRRDVTDFDTLAAMFADSVKFPGWAEVSWAKPTGAELDAVVERLKALKLTFRNVPGGAAPAEGTCLFTGKPAVERILVARAY